MGSVLYLLLSDYNESSVSGSTFKFNSGEGLFFLNQALLSVKQSTISSNMITGYQMSPGIFGVNSDLTTESVTFYNQTGSKGVYLSAQLYSNFNDTNSTFELGTASSGGVYVLQSNVRLVSSSFSNIFSRYTGVLYAFSSSTLTLSGVTMNDIRSKLAGIRVESDSTLTMGSSVLSNFNATAISAEMSILSISDSTVKDISAENGGVLSCSDCTSLSISGSTFKNGTATGTGGCIYLTSETLYTYSLTNNIFYSCSAVHAGAVYSESLSLTLLNNNFSHNSATGDSTDDSDMGSGGALNLNCDEGNCKFNLMNNVFEYNSAKFNGGGVAWNDVEPDFTNNTYTKNYAVYGSDIACFGSYLDIESTPTERRYLSAKLEEVASGQTGNHLEISLKDKYGNTVTTDNLSSASILAIDNSVVLGGVTTVTASGGVYTFSSFSITATPGSSQTVSVKSAAINSASSSAISIPVELRYCESGEIQTSANACTVCDEGQYSLALNSTICNACPSSAECLGGANLFPISGYWRSSEATDKIFSCLLEEACLGNENYTSKTGVCEDGYESNLCQSCRSGWSRTSKNTCQLCPEESVNALRLSGIGLGVMIYVVIMVRSTLLSASKPKELHSVYIKVLTNYLQLVLLVTSFNLNWPSLVKSLLSTQESVGSATEQLFSFDCYLDNNSFSAEVFYQKLIVVGLMPLIIVGLSTAFWIPVAFKRRDYTVLRNQLVTTIIVLLFLAHPSIVQMMFRVFSCMEIDSEEYWLLEDLSMKCWNSEHNLYAMAVGLPGLVGWGLGIPSFALWLLIKKRRTLMTREVKSKYGFLYIGFKSEHFFWEFVILYRKIAIAFTSVFLSTISAEIQALTVMIVILIALYLQLWYQPYEVEDLNMIETRAIVVAGITIYSGLYFLTNDIGEETKILLFLVILLSNLYFILLWIFGISKTLLEKLAAKFPYFILKFCGCIPSLRGAAMRSVKDLEGELFYGTKIEHYEEKNVCFSKVGVNIETTSLLTKIQSPADFFIMMIKEKVETP
eukprot:CAMPEP_0204898508 /NCGR_PEP_ID=MMETSP1397-20131031/1335_1 /ASSEMBLY_ACC=CAM_ASM_000891 /TAXON_ID=49980 /ORGANISM="Climacostomum Climacostomum virens, Strain Stock W-24" /LENGTH=1022 /DNA_ID=CAMNT_0052066371 /DNA_START=57 /DNA_END=3125 /DNA_ORIENTATION=-